MSTPRILALAGSTRRGSFNAQLMRLAASSAAAGGADVTILDLQEYPLPLFHEDDERDHGTPENAKRLKELFIQHRGLLIASPEYNSSITPLLKNTIDWVSRRADGEPPLVAYKGKVAGLMSASPGTLGGLRGLVHVRSILSNIGVLVVPDQVAVPNAHQAFDDHGRLKDDALQKRVATLAHEVVELTRQVQQRPEA